MSALFSVSELRKSFGAIVVADGTSFDVVAGEAVGIIGPNGAGKTSLFNLITGVIRPDSGRITFGGDDITEITAAARCRLGIARSFQIPQPFDGMTVFENRAGRGGLRGAGLPDGDAREQAVSVLGENRSAREGESASRFPDLA